MVGRREEEKNKEKEDVFLVHSLFILLRALTSFYQYDKTFQLINSIQQVPMNLYILNN